MAGDGAVRFYRPDGEYGELSNFYPLSTPIRMCRMTFPTSEHLYQAHKYIGNWQSEANNAYAFEISMASTPGKSQILGNRRRLYRYPWQIELNRIMDKHPDARIIDGFHEKKLDTMLWVLQSKFRADKHCREVLLSTGDRPLIEASPIDDFWGEGKDKKGEESPRAPAHGGARRAAQTPAHLMQHRGPRDHSPFRNGFVRLLHGGPRARRPPSHRVPLPVGDVRGVSRNLDV